MLSNETTNKQHSQPTINWRAAMTLSWSGQMVASGCWIASVFAYGLTSTGDGLQLAAASAWLIANLFSLREFRP